MAPTAAATSHHPRRPARLMVAAVCMLAGCLSLWLVHGLFCIPMRSAHASHKVARAAAREYAPRQPREGDFVSEFDRTTAVDDDDSNYGRVYVGGLPPDITEGEVFDHFAENFAVHKAKMTGATTAAVLFDRSVNLNSVVAMMDSSIIEGGSFISVKVDRNDPFAQPRATRPSNRVVVDGFSGNVGAQDIRDYFSQAGNVRQVVFRGSKLALVCFTSPEEAQRAVKMFDKSIITGDVTAVDVRQESNLDFQQSEARRGSRNMWDGQIRSKNTAGRVAVFARTSDMENVEMDTIKAHFGDVANVKEVKFLGSNGWLVFYETMEEARTAVKKLDFTVMQGTAGLLRCKLDGSPDTKIRNPRRFLARQERMKKERMGAAYGEQSMEPMSPQFYRPRERQR